MSNAEFLSPDDCNCQRSKGWIIGPCDCLKNENYPLVQIPKVDVTYKGKKYQPRTTVDSDNRLTPDWNRVRNRFAHDILAIHRNDSERYKDREKSVISYLNNENFVCENHPGFQQRVEKLLNFWNGSAYIGKWDSLGLAGKGTYIMNHGLVYTGELFDGRFHGKGVLTYPMGTIMDCVYDKGTLVEYKVKFWNDLDYQIPWTYCQMPDRRFHHEVLNGFLLGPKCIKIKDRETPPNCYDTGDGFYNIKMGCIYSARIPAKVLRVSNEAEQNWIKEKCRKGLNKPVGYKPELLEKFTTGLKDLDKKFSQSLLDFDGSIIKPSNEQKKASFEAN